MKGARELTALVLLPLVLLAIRFLPPWVFLSVVWIVAVMAAWEFLQMLRRLGHPVLLVPALLLVAGSLPALWVGGLDWAGAILSFQVLSLPLLHLLGRKPIAGASAGIAGSTFVAVYFTVAAGAIGLLRTSFPDPAGWKVVLIFCLAVWAGDSGAYYVGSNLGRHRLAPKVSPKKSWEGIAGGAALTFLGVWVCRLVFFPELDAAVAWILAALLTVLAPLGDLVESIFKRDADIKDSSHLIPGHGGFLDRSDSLFYAAPFVLALLLIVEGLG